MTSTVIIRSGAGRSRRQRKPTRKTPAIVKGSPLLQAGAVHIVDAFAFGAKSPEEILGEKLHGTSLEDLKEIGDLLKGLRPGMTIRGLGGVEFPEEILDSLRPGSLTLGGDDRGAELAQRLEQVLPSLKVGSLAVGLEKPASKPSKSSPGTQEVVDKFLVAKRIKVRPPTLKSYRGTLRPFARRFPTLPTKPEQIEEYLVPYGTERTTAKDIYIVIRLLYNFAEKRKLLPFPNPMTMVEKPSGKPRPPEHATINQALALRNAIQGDRERALFYCLFGQGLRLRETRLIRVADIGEDTILIHGKRRDEPMPLIAEVRDALLRLAKGKRPDEFIFSGRRGQPLADTTIQLIIKNLFSRAGVTGVRPSPHSLRHSRGVITDIAGLNSYSSRRLLRHTTTQMTDRYTELNLEELKAKEETYNPLRVLDRIGHDNTLCPIPNVLATSDPAQLLPHLLDQLIALGQLAHELRHVLGDDGHRPEELKEIAQYLEPSL